MIQKLNFNMIQRGVSKLLKKHLDYNVYTHVPDDAKAPFIFIESSLTPYNNNTKTNFLEWYRVDIHIVSDIKNSKADIFNKMSLVRETMTEEIEVGEDFKIITQIEDGIPQPRLNQETKEYEATLAFIFKVAYLKKRKDDE